MTSKQTLLFKKHLSSHPGASDMFLSLEIDEQCLFINEICDTDFAYTYGNENNNSDDGSNSNSNDNDKNADDDTQQEDDDGITIQK
jgi:hypothetical protein